MNRASILRYGALPDQHLELLAGGGDAARRPLVVLLHGGFWRSGYDRTHMNELARALVSAGWSVANVEYRRVPGEPDATLVDVEAALAALPTPDIASDGHLLLVGFSAGGQLALWLAAASGNSRLMGVIGLAPVADLVLAQRLGLSDGAVDEFLGAQTSRLKLIDPRQLPDARCPSDCCTARSMMWCQFPCLSRMWPHTGRRA